jgi:hypothetical protein
MRGPLAFETDEFERIMPYGVLTGGQQDQTAGQQQKDNHDRNQRTGYDRGSPTRTTPVGDGHRDACC